MLRVQKRRRIHGKQAPRPASPERLWGEASVAVLIGVRLTVYRRMKCLGCPLLLFELLKCVAAAQAVTNADYSPLMLFEVFCGVAAITRAFQNGGFLSTGYDILADPHHNNLNSSSGFVYALVMALRLDEADGLMWLATVCSSWVWMARGSTGRTMDLPLGVPCQSTYIANKMVARCGALILLCICIGCEWALEQPASSLMESHPTLRWLASRAGTMINADWHQSLTSMGAFNAQSLKRTKLYGNRRTVLALARHGVKNKGGRQANMDIVRYGYAESGSLQGARRTVTKGTQLKETQAYTDEFGVAVFETWLACGQGAAIEDSGCDGPDGPYEVPSGVWDLAELESVLRFATT